jgi:transposase
VGYDAGKKIKGKKRDIVVDRQALLIHSIVHAADIQDRDGGELVMATMFGMFPFLLSSTPMADIRARCFAPPSRKSSLKSTSSSSSAPNQAKAFVVLPRRWVVKRTFAWLGRCRRLAKDWENLNRKALAFLRLASVRLMLRKLCNPA